MKNTFLPIFFLLTLPTACLAQKDLASDYTIIDSIRSVDLGLSVKWADRNIGAEFPEVYGYFYAWGETEVKSTYNWDTYLLCSSEGKFDLNKYNNKENYGFLDSLSILQTIDDAAYSLSVGKWRIPTKEEWHELITRCKWQSETVNGVAGQRVIAPNGNSIFLPTAEPKDAPKYFSRYCDYWSSSLNSKRPYQAYGVRNGRILYNDRYKGFPIRAVLCSSPQNVTLNNYSPTNDSIRMVDLGLSVKWADRNIGAERSELSGDYYAWGETEVKSTYNWDTYQLCGSEMEYDFLRYNTEEKYVYVDSLVVLQMYDDVAASSSEWKWRIPTKEEWQELITKCTWKDEIVNGVIGKRVIAPNGNSIFLPAAEHKGASNFDGGHCDYWSSSLDPQYPYQAYIMRNSRIKKDYRYKGYPIRPVCE